MFYAPLSPGVDAHQSSEVYGDRERRNEMPGMPANEMERRDRRVSRRARSGMPAGERRRDGEAGTAAQLCLRELDAVAVSTQKEVALRHNRQAACAPAATGGRPACAGGASGVLQVGGKRQREARRCAGGGRRAIRQQLRAIVRRARSPVR